MAKPRNLAAGTKAAAIGAEPFIGETFVNDYKKIKAKYLAYLTAYKKLNKGSLKGAVTFGEFYMNQIYHSIYNDERIIALMGYN